MCERRCGHIAYSDNEEDIAREYSRLVTRCVRRFSLPGSEREDLYQEGMIALLKAMRSYDEGKNDNFEAYAALCIKRRLIDAVRRRAPEETSELSENLSEGPDGSADPLNAIVDAESAKEIHASLKSSLSQLEGDVLDLYMDGYTIREIALKLDRSEKSVGNAVARIRGKLGRYLNSRRKQG